MASSAEFGGVSSTKLQLGSSEAAWTFAPVSYWPDSNPQLPDQMRLFDPNAGCNLTWNRTAMLNSKPKCLHGTIIE